jgi:hypothetical protein
MKRRGRRRGFSDMASQSIRQRDRLLVGCNDWFGGPDERTRSRGGGSNDVACAVRAAPIPLRSWAPRVRCLLTVATCAAGVAASGAALGWNRATPVQHAIGPANHNLSGGFAAAHAGFHFLDDLSFLLVDGNVSCLRTAHRVVASGGKPARQTVRAFEGLRQEARNDSGIRCVMPVAVRDCGCS